jgi:integrase
MERRCKAAEIASFGFKGIRHLVAVTLYRSGHPVAEIQRRLRHESPTTTEKYLRSLGLEIGAENVIETLADLENGDIQGDKRKGSAPR